ncbi:MAG TPA: CTP synthase (glutamine hydrolyzing) [Methanomicrobia archaeon]|nr:CTP synthase (glutamine hydrolyzing) [Methanomicrobia archaeon]
MRYIIVTGGVLSGLGKGVTTASIAKILQSMGYKVTVIKIDPYLNVDAGTMSPFEHGEVFVLDDGGEVDLDLGNYERFLNVDLTRDHNITTGKIYKKVIEKERRGDYLGKTVQPIPHLTDEIKSEIRKVAEKYDFTVIEIGGTVGDIESMPFLEACRQLSWEEDVVFIHVTLVPSLDVVGEQKTKPTQHSVKKLMETGISPHIIVCRSKKELLEKTKKKIAQFCNVSEDHVISNHDVDDIYKVPLLLNEQRIGEKIIDKFGLRRKPNLEKWRSIISRKCDKDVTLALVGKYIDLHDSYISIREALMHCSYYTGVNVKIRWLESERMKKEDLEGVDGILVPGGFGIRGTEEKISAINYAREKKIPFLGICLGFQLATIEYARSIGLKNANSTEFVDTDEPVIDLLPEQKKIKNMGGTMRLGAYKIILDNQSTVYNLYGSKEIYERHRHRYEVNPQYIDILTRDGLKFTGRSEDGRMEVLELEDHPFFLGTQYHPEFTSRVERPSPVFMGLVKAMARYSNP